MLSSARVVEGNGREYEQADAEHARDQRRVRIPLRFQVHDPARTERREHGEQQPATRGADTTCTQGASSRPRLRRHHFVVARHVFTVPRLGRASERNHFAAA